MVVVSHYNARPTTQLVDLLDATQTLPSGWPFGIRVVVNLGVPKRLVLPARHQQVEILYRENTGYNIGAWDHGWRTGGPAMSYLFLQEECRLLRPDWLAAFVRQGAATGVGLVGECLSPHWDALWEDLVQRCRGERLEGHLVDGQPADRVPCYLDFFRRHGIPSGRRADHLQSLILYARREVLQAINGFPVGRNYGEAIAAEIGISKKVQSLGLRIGEVGPHPFHYIEHPQWLHRRNEPPHK
jgi:hypothetical protein